MKSCKKCTREIEKGVYCLTCRMKKHKKIEKQYQPNRVIGSGQRRRGEKEYEDD